MITQTEIQSLTEPQAQRLYEELCTEATSWNELAFQVYRHLRVLRRPYEPEQVPVVRRMQVQNRTSKPESRRDVLIAQLSRAIQKKGLKIKDLSSLFNE